MPITFKYFFNLQVIFTNKKTSRLNLGHELFYINLKLLLIFKIAIPAQWVRANEFPKKL